MPVLTNHRHERFTQLLAAAPKGMTVTDAYEKAGYRRNDGNASTLARHPQVQGRLKEIKGELAEKAVVTAESLMKEAEEVRVRAMERGQLNAAVAAIKEKGVLSGKRVERSEVGGPGQFDHLSDEELRAEIVRECRELGYIIDGSEPQH